MGTITIKSAMVERGAWACKCCGEPENDASDTECQECGAARYEEKAVKNEDWMSDDDLLDIEYNAGRRAEERFAAQFE